MQLSEIDAQREIAKSQAELISVGLKEADIDIVGGESVFFDRLVGAIAYGKSVDGFVESSDVVKRALAGYVAGESDVVEDVKEILSGVAGVAARRGAAPAPADET